MTDRKYNELLKAYIKENKAVPGGYDRYTNKERNRPKTRFFTNNG